MSNLRRSASLDRLLAETDFRHKVSADRTKCRMLGYPYCCTGHYYSYRYWPFHLDHRVADHGCHIGHPYSYHQYPYDLWPSSRYYSEYLRGYDYGQWKYGNCVNGGCVWCPPLRRPKRPATAVACHRLGCCNCRA